MTCGIELENIELKKQIKELTEIVETLESKIKEMLIERTDNGKGK